MTVERRIIYVFTCDNATCNIQVFAQNANNRGEANQYVRDVWMFQVDKRGEFCHEHRGDA